MEDSDTRLRQIQEKWRKEYDKTIPQKLELLKRLVNEMKGGIEENTLKAFRIEIHKIAGSAGTVGYMPVSDICKKMDQELVAVIEHFKESPPSSEWVSQLEAQIKLISEGFAKVSA